MPDMEAKLLDGYRVDCQSSNEYDSPCLSKSPGRRGENRKMTGRRARANTFHTDAGLRIADQGNRRSALELAGARLTLTKARLDRAAVQYPVGSFRAESGEKTRA